MRLFVGDDWAEDHHDVELMDAAGRVLARKRLPEGVAGMARLHELIGQQLGEDGEDTEVLIGIETDRGPWVAALVAAGYTVYAVNPLEAFDDLDAPDALELLAKAPDPARAAKLTRAQISAALKRARRRDITGKATAIITALRSGQLGQPPAVTAAYAVTVRSLIAVISTLNEQVKALEGQVEAYFGRHPDAEIYLSQPGLGYVLGARVLGEFGDDPDRYVSGKTRKNYAATSPITRASGKKKVVAARFIHNDRLIDALMAQAFAAMNASPGARALYDAERASGTDHNPALRKLANRLVGILHGCLKTRTLYDEATAWSHHENKLAA